MPPRKSSTTLGLVDPVFHREGSGYNLEILMCISAMPEFRHMSLEELRVADWNLERQLKAAEEDRKPPSSSSSSSSSSKLGFARFNLPEGYVPLFPPKLGTGTDKSDQAGAAVVPPTPMPAPTANSTPQVHHAPQPSGLGSQADTSPVTFPLCPAAEQNSAVADAEKEWVHASRQAHETKAQLAKAKAQLAEAQAAHDQAIMMEKLKFKAYYEARSKAD